MHYCVFYSSRDIVSLLGYMNSSWVENNLDTRSTTGCIFQLGLSPISSSNKNFGTLYISSCEAKCKPAKEAVWI